MQVPKRIYQYIEYIKEKLIETTKKKNLHSFVEVEDQLKNCVKCILPREEYLSAWMDDIQIKYTNFYLLFV